MNKEKITLLLILKPCRHHHTRLRPLTVYPYGTSVKTLKDNHEEYDSIEVDVLRCKVHVPAEGIRFNDEWDYIDWVVEAEGIQTN